MIWRAEQNARRATKEEETGRTLLINSYNYFDLEERKKKRR
jgi:hypothetical protein